MKERVKPPPVKSQGKVIVERGDAGDILVMMPDGEVHIVQNVGAAFKRANAWCKSNMDKDAINVATIEWRHGLKPPEGK